MTDLSQEIDKSPEQASPFSQGSDQSNNDSSEFITVTYDRRGRLLKPSIKPDDITLACQSPDDTSSEKDVCSYLPVSEPSDFNAILQRNQEWFENSLRRNNEFQEQLQRWNKEFKEQLDNSQRRNKEFQEQQEKISTILKEALLTPEQRINHDNFFSITTT